MNEDKIMLRIWSIQSKSGSMSNLQPVQPSPGRHKCSRRTPNSLRGYPVLARAQCTLCLHISQRFRPTFIRIPRRRRLLRVCQSHGRWLSNRNTDGSGKAYQQKIIFASENCGSEGMRCHPPLRQDASSCTL